MFPVQTITTVDSCVVQLDYLDGRLLVSSLTRSFLCDTERYTNWPQPSYREHQSDFPGRSTASHRAILLLLIRNEVNASWWWYRGDRQSIGWLRQAASDPSPVLYLSAMRVPSTCWMCGVGKAALSFTVAPFKMCCALNGILLMGTVG